MTEVINWSKTDSGNANGVTPDFWPENAQADTVNDCARAMMGGIRRVFGNMAGRLNTGGNSASCNLTHNVTSHASGNVGLAVFTYTNGLNASALFDADPGPGNEIYRDGDIQAIKSHGAVANQMTAIVRTQIIDRCHITPMDVGKTQILASGSITSAITNLDITGLTAVGAIHIYLGSIKNKNASQDKLAMRFGKPAFEGLSGTADYEYAMMKADENSVLARGSTSTSSILIQSTGGQSRTTGGIRFELRGFNDGTQTPSVKWRTAYKAFDGEELFNDGHGSMTRQFSANSVRFFFVDGGFNFTADATNPIFYRIWKE